MFINAERFRTICARKCLKRKDILAKGVAINTIYRIQHHMKIRPYTVGKVAKALDVDVTELIEDFPEGNETTR